MRMRRKVARRDRTVRDGSKDARDQGFSRVRVLWVVEPRNMAYELVEGGESP